jgi:two-component sensor histidine kinase
MPCGMILNELVHNACHHAFPTGAGQVLVGYAVGDDGRHCLSIQDNGTGIAVDVPASGSLGLQLVTALVRQIGGSLEVASDAGTCIVIRFWPTTSEPT